MLFSLKLLISNATDPTPFWAGDLCSVCYCLLNSEVVKLAMTVPDTSEYILDHATIVYQLLLILTKLF